MVCTKRVCLLVKTCQFKKVSASPLHNWRAVFEGPSSFKYLKNGELMKRGGVGGRAGGGKMSEPSASSLLFTDLIHQGPLVLQYGKTRRSWVRVSLTTYRKSSSKSPREGGGAGLFIQTHLRWAYLI